MKENLHRIFLLTSLAPLQNAFESRFTSGMGIAATTPKILDLGIFPFLWSAQVPARQRHITLDWDLNRDAQSLGQLYPLDVVKVGDVLVIPVVEDGFQRKPYLGWNLSVPPQSGPVDIVEPGPLAIVGELKLFGPHRHHSLSG